MKRSILSLMYLVQGMRKAGIDVDAKLQTMESSHSFRMKNNLVAPGARLNAPLTDEQKADMKKMAEQRLAIQKENLSRLVSAGQITQAQADAKIAWMQKRIDAGFEKGFAGHGGLGMGGKGPGQGPRF